MREEPSMFTWRSYRSEAAPQERQPPALPWGRTPPVGDLPPATGDCPVCWVECELNLAGRIKPHVFALDGTRCSGAGELPKE